MNCSVDSKLAVLTGLFAFATLTAYSLAEEVGEMWGTAVRERAYYQVIDLPIPKDLVVEAGAFVTLPDGRIAVGTRRGDIFIIKGVDDEKPRPTYELFATGLDEIFGLEFRNGAFYVTQSCELTRITDRNGDGKADNFETISDSWGYANYHEYAFGSKFDSLGNLYIALGLSNSYHSRALFRGWAMKVTPMGKTIPIASGLRSPGGIGFNEHGALFYIESQGPWNSSCSLKSLKEGGFMGHPVSFNWYEHASNIGKRPNKPKSGGRIITERKKVKELVPYAVIFPYIRMGRSITGFVVNQTKGKFGPFENQIFLGDYTQSVVMRATTEKVNEVWQGACYPFREGLSTGILNIGFTPEGNLLCGGTNRGWPVRGIKPFALEKLVWTGQTPFEIECITISPKGFTLSFTKPVDSITGNQSANYKVSTFTHIYHGGYGGPEVDQSKPIVTSAIISENGLNAEITLSEIFKGHVYEFDLSSLRSRTQEKLLHKNAYYTVNEVPIKR